MKLLRLCSFGLLALCGCNAFDEDRLIAQQAAFARAQDASTPDDPAAPSADAAASEGDDDPPPLIDERDEPRLPNDAGTSEERPDAPAIEDVQGDEDAGVVEECECDALRTALAHRYTFEGTGTTMYDARGNAPGTVVNTSLDGKGGLALAGGSSDQYAVLPKGLFTGLTSATIEAWVTWDGGAGWQRIFDFGSSQPDPDGTTHQVGATYLMMSPLINDRSLGAAYANDGSDSAIYVESAESFTIGAVQHVALVFDGESHQMKLYLNGALVGGAVVQGALSALVEQENLLGRSHYSWDTSFGGTLHELRIYRTALTAAQIASSHAEGTDPEFLAAD